MKQFIIIHVQTYYTVEITKTKIAENEILLIRSKTLGPGTRLYDCVLKFKVYNEYDYN